MARGKKDNPINMAESDIAETLRRASGQLVEANNGLEAARLPIKEAKAAVKASGIDFDIFNVFHGIRHLEDDAARQRRIDKVRIACKALLGDKVQIDLFGSVAVVSVAPAAQETLRKASDALHAAAPEDEQESDGIDTDAADESEATPPAIADPEAATDDAPALVLADDMPEEAGRIFNNGVEAGRKGFGPEDNPHDPDSAEYALWERGRVNGATQVYADEPSAVAEAQFCIGGDEAGGFTVERIDGAEVVLTAPNESLAADIVEALNRAQALSSDPLLPEQVREGVRPLLIDASVMFEGRFAAYDGAVEQPADSAVSGPVKFTGSTKQQRIQAYFHGLDGAAAGQDLSALTKGRRGEIKAQIETGFGDGKDGVQPRHERSDAPKVIEQPDEAQEYAGNDEDLSDEDAEQDADSIVAVREAGEKHELYDTRSGFAIIDTDGLASGTVWADQINGHFIGQRDDVTHADLADAAKTLALGRRLSVPTTPVATSSFAVA